MRIVAVKAGKFAGQFVAQDEDGMTFKGKDVVWSGGRFIAWEGREWTSNEGKKKTDPAIGYQSKEHEAQMNDHIFALLDQAALPTPQRQTQMPAARPAASGFGRTPAPADDQDLPF